MPSSIENDRKQERAFYRFVSTLILIDRQQSEGLERSLHNKKTRLVPSFTPQLWLAHLPMNVMGKLRIPLVFWCLWWLRMYTTSCYDSTIRGEVPGKKGRYVNWRRRWPRAVGTVVCRQKGGVRKSVLAFAESRRLIFTRIIMFFADLARRINLKVIAFRLQHPSIYLFIHSYIHPIIQASIYPFIHLPTSWYRQQ